MLMDGGKDGVDIIEHELAVFLRRVESARRRQPLDRSAYLLLGELDTCGPIRISALAETFQLDISTASRQTTVLESRGLVERLPAPEDGRVSLLQITPLGRAKLEETRTARIALIASVIEDWPEDDRREFGDYLARFNRALARHHRLMQDEGA